MAKLLIYIIVFSVSSLAGCTGNLLSVHKPEIQQGNALTEADIRAIVPGMTQSQVRERLGAPVLNPAFNQNRWDYIYYRKPSGSAEERLGLSVQFKNGKVLQVFQNTNVMKSDDGS